MQKACSQCITYIVYRGLRTCNARPYGFVCFAFSKEEKGDRAAVDEDAAVLLVADCGGSSHFAFGKMLFTRKASLEADRPTGFCDCRL